MLLRPFLHEEGSCASYLFGCTTHGKLAVVDPRFDLIDEYLESAAIVGAPIVAVFDTHLHADHVSGMARLVEKTGATAYAPAGAGISFHHDELEDGAVIELGNTVVTVAATPGHAPAHNAYLVADRRRGTEEPWLVFSGDSLLVGDVGRPDLHLADAAAQARLLFASLQRLLQLPDHVLLLPSHYGGSVCGRALSSNPFSTIGFERAHNRMLGYVEASAFAAALLEDVPPAPHDQAGIVAANRAGGLVAAG